jgi:trigger factor
LKITSERKPDSQVLLEIEVDPERLQKSMDQAYRRIVGKYRIPGFRPGKAPRIMFERYVGRETLLREALETLVPEVYDEAVKDQSLDPIDQPRFEIPEVEPLRIKATVPIRPTLDLKDYRSIRVEREEPAAVSDQVEQNLVDLRRRYATVEPVERPVQPGDIVRLDISTRSGNMELLSETYDDLRVTEQDTNGLPGLLEKIPGSEKGKSYDFEVEVPETDPDKTVAGKTVVYHVDIKEVKEEKIPEPTDDFAREVGEGFDSFAALRERVESDVRKRSEDEAEREFEQKVLDTLIEQAGIEYPLVLIEREIDHIISEQTGGRSLASLAIALRGAGRTEQEFRDELRPAAKQRVERSLVLTELATGEGLAVDADDVEAELDRLSGPIAPQNERRREMFDTPTGREFIDRTLLTRKVYQRLRDIADGKEVPPPPEKAGPAEAATPITDSVEPVAQSAGSEPVTNDESGMAKDEESTIKGRDTAGGDQDKLHDVRAAEAAPREA